MQLATRCSACGTIFRVMEDQLKASDGWVRCGRCNAVFDGLDGMVDLEQAGMPAGSEPALTAENQAVQIGIHDLLARHDESGFAESRREPQLEPPPAAPAAADPLDFDLDELPQAGPQRTGPAVESGAEVPRAVAAATPRWATPTPPPVRPATPDFVRRAEREAHWHSPAMRAALIGSSLILLLMLALQVLYHQRDTIAA